MDYPAHLEKALVGPRRDGGQEPDQEPHRSKLRCSAVGQLDAWIGAVPWTALWWRCTCLSFPDADSLPDGTALLTQFVVT